MLVVVQLHEIASYCLVKVLFFFQLPLTCQSFYCGDSDLSGYHVSLVDIVGKCPTNDDSHCISPTNDGSHCISLVAVLSEVLFCTIPNCCLLFSYILHVLMGR